MKSNRLEGKKGKRPNRPGGRRGKRDGRFRSMRSKSTARREGVKRAGRKCLKPTGGGTRGSLWDQNYKGDGGGDNANRVMKGRENKGKRERAS